MRRSLVALAPAVAMTVAAAIPAARAAAKDVPALWSPVSDWRPVVYLMPLLLSLAALAWGIRDRGALVLRVAAGTLAAGWGVLLLFQGLGETQF